MSKLSVTYKAPKDDTKVVVWGGHTFFDGKVTEIDADDPANAAIVAALANHPLFDVSGGTTTAATGQQNGAVETQSEDKEEEDDDIKDKDIKKKGSRW